MEKADKKVIYFLIIVAFCSGLQAQNHESNKSQSLISRVKENFKKRTVAVAKHPATLITLSSTVVLILIWQWMKSVNSTVSINSPTNASGVSAANPASPSSISPKLTVTSTPTAPGVINSDVPAKETQKTDNDVLPNSTKTNNAQTEQGSSSNEVKLDFEEDDFESGEPSVPLDAEVSGIEGLRKFLHEKEDLLKKTKNQDLRMVLEGCIKNIRDQLQGLEGIKADPYTANRNVDFRKWVGLKAQEQRLSSDLQKTQQLKSAAPDVVQAAYDPILQDTQEKLDAVARDIAALEKDSSNFAAQTGNPPPPPRRNKHQGITATMFEAPNLSSRA